MFQNDFIQKAIEGDALVINDILRRYDGYIRTLSTKRVYDIDGNEYHKMDEDLHRRIQTRLILAIPKFKG